MLTAADPAPAEAATVGTNAWHVLVNHRSGKAPDVSGTATAEGARVSQWTRSDEANQQWQFVDSGGGFHRLKARHSGEVLDVAGASTADGAAIQQWGDLNGPNQQWQMVKLASSGGGGCGGTPTPTSGTHTIHDPESPGRHYAELVTNAHPSIAAFGCSNNTDRTVTFRAEGVCGWAPDVSGQWVTQ
ncbi:RICIN domain-containing protein [Streptomyces sp. NPDC058812]|uniref:RICIN domain-containing protein n=1 Tax=Streptomyces sp. NPDC058812 TaxID=3346639 RepID=UPI003688F187